MGDILDELRSPSFPMGQRFALCREAADEIVRLREELGDLEAYAAAWTDTANRHARTADRWQARAERAEADADRLAGWLGFAQSYLGTLGASLKRDDIAKALALHDREVEAR